MLNAIEKDLDTRFAGVKDDMVLGMAYTLQQGGGTGVETGDHGTVPGI